MDWKKFARYALRNWLFLAVLLGFWATTGFASPRIVGGPDNAWDLSSPQISLLVETEKWPALTAKSAIVEDVDSGEVLFSKAPHERLAPASLTKLMTAAVVLEKADLNREVTVPGAALVGGSSMGLRAGERITVRDLLYGMLIPSGNDAATALAIAVGGSVPKFAEMMNRKAAELGMKDSHFVNPHGMDAPGHYSSAADMLLLAHYLYDNYPLFRKVVATRQVTVSGHPLWNRNELLGTYPGVNGIKTGTTEAAEECLLVSAVYRGHQVLVVVMGSQDRYGEVRALLDHYRKYFVWVAPPPLWPRLRLFDTSTGAVFHSPGNRDFFVPRWQLPWLQYRLSWQPESTPALVLKLDGRVLMNVPVSTQ